MFKQSMEAFSVTQVFKDSDVCMENQRTVMARHISVKSAHKKSEITCLFVCLFFTFFVQIVSTRHHWLWGLFKVR